MPKMPKTPPPRNFSTWSPDRQQAWVDAMLATEEEKAAQGPMKSATVDSAMRAAKRREMMAEKPKRPASPTTVQPPKQRPPTLGGTIRSIDEYNKRLESYKGGGPVKKKAVAKMTPKKKTVAKPAARRGMGKAMRGR